MFESVIVGEFRVKIVILLEFWATGKTMTLTASTHKSLCTNYNSDYQLLGQNIPTFPEILCIGIFPNLTLPLNRSILVGFGYPMLHIKFQGHRSISSGEDF